MAEALGKVAVVTGAASGIGFALAQRFAGEGMHVVLADIEEAALYRAVAELSESGADVMGVVTDVSRSDSVDALARTACERFGTVHVVCSNAGVGGHHYPVWEVPLSYWEWVLSVNLLGVVHGLRSFLPLLVDQDEGHVVNTASVAGLMGFAYLAPYVATKHAIVGISQSLYNELAAIGSGVKVSVLCPGGVRTRFADADRNWPARLGQRPASANDAGARAMHEAVRTGTNVGLAPSRVADLVLDAIHSGRFMVLTDPDYGPPALALLTACLEGKAPVVPRVG